MTDASPSASPRNANLQPSGSAPDLTASEADLAVWFSGLERLEAPGYLRTRIVASVEAGQEADRAPAGRLVRMFPLGAWGLATAALLLLAIGTVATVELGTDLAEPAAVGTRTAGPGAPLVIVEDPTLAIFHEIETFDEVGLAPDELIADWQR